MVALLLLALFAGDDWDKVTALPSGAELRITKTGARAPILATMDHATAESLIVATKTEQFAIAKEQILKLEARPLQKQSRVQKTTTVDNTPVNKEAARPTPGPSRTPGPSGSASSSVTIGGKPDFELVYTRRPAAK